MKVKDLINALKAIPEYEVVLSKVFVVPDADNPDEMLEACFDIPVIGLAVNEDDNEVRLVLGCDKSFISEMGAEIDD